MIYLNSWLIECVYSKLSRYLLFGWRIRIRFQSSLVSVCHCVLTWYPNCHCFPVLFICCVSCEKRIIYIYAHSQPNSFLLWCFASFKSKVFSSIFVVLVITSYQSSKTTNWFLDYKYWNSSAIFRYIFASKIAILKGVQKLYHKLVLVPYIKSDNFE